MVVAHRYWSLKFREISVLCLFLGAVFLVAGPAWSKVPAEQAARLGQDLTPVGAERAGNDDGSIPEWTGGLTGVPDHVAFDGQGHYPDPYADDTSILTITNDNAAAHEAFLTDGQRAMLAAHPQYKMAVYPTRRSCAFPDGVYQAGIANATRGEIAGAGATITNVIGGVPFPILQSGVEAVWNHNLRYRGFKVERTFASAAPSRSGSYSPIIVKDELIFNYADPQRTSFEDLEGVSFKYVQETLSPSRRAGQLLLVHETLDPADSDRKSWQYTMGDIVNNPRVQRTPTASYDNPQIYSDAMSTADNFDMFSGLPDRYDWQLVGKSEKYIAYNSYKVSSPDLSYDDIVLAGHLNQDVVRYEKHRVWEVDATMKSSQRHVYHRRVKYFDEDSWNMVAGDLYDARGNLWRVQEAHLIQYYDVPTCFNASDVVYDLAEGRYVVQNLKNEEDGISFSADHLSDGAFTPNQLRRRVVRR